MAIKTAHQSGLSGNTFCRSDPSPPSQIRVKYQTPVPMHEIQRSALRCNNQCASRLELVRSSESAWFVAREGDYAIAIQVFYVKTTNSDQRQKCIRSIRCYTMKRPQLPSGMHLQGFWSNEKISTNRDLPSIHELDVWCDDDGITVFQSLPHFDSGFPS